MQQYRRFLEEAPETAMTPEACAASRTCNSRSSSYSHGNAKPREWRSEPPRYSRLADRQS